MRNRPMTVLALAVAIMIAAQRPAFVRAQGQDGVPAIYAVGQDGAGLELVSEGGGWDPAWSPDGTRLAYAALTQEGGVVVVAEPDDTAGIELAAGPDPRVAPSWSPDGERIAFLTYERTGMTLSVAEVDGSGVTKLADAGQAYPTPPAWSPDGRRIAFAGPGAGGSDVWVINADGTDARQLTDLPGEVLGPTWSPDGSHIAFGDATFDSSSSNALYVMIADGSGLTELTSWRAPEKGAEDPGGARPSPVADSTAVQGTPVWSPDSARLAFATIGGLAVIGVDGSGLEVIPAAAIPADEFHVMDPTWSPAGTRIAFGGSSFDAEFDPSHDTYDDLYVVNADGTGLVRLAATPLVDRSPAWSPDGLRIAFASEPPGE